MKQMKSITMVVAVSLFSLFTMAQSSKRSVPGVSDNGYWVVESNVKTPRNSIIHFYNNNDELVYRETLQDVKLNTDRKKVRIKLQKVLESAVIAWQKNKQPAMDKDYVKVMLK